MSQFIEILKESFTKGIIGWLSWLVPTTCTLTSQSWDQLPGIKDVYQLIGKPGLIGFCCILLLIRIVYVLYKRYSSVLKTLNIKEDPKVLLLDLDECLIDLNTAKESTELSVRLDNLRKFCNSAKNLFDKISNTRCCVSIKAVSDCQITSSIKELVTKQVINIKHDDSNNGRHSEEYAVVEHLISENTAFNNVANIIYKNKHYYIGKNLRQDINYLTSSAKCSQAEGKIYNQDLPYDSELVYPIFKKIGGNNQICLRGFLCIDSNSSEGFVSDRVDVAFARILANGLYDLIPDVMPE